MRLLDELTAHARRAVNNRHTGARLRRGKGSAKTRRAAADHEHIRALHPSTPLPRCVRTSMPSRSGVTQVFTLGVPSTVIMQEEQLPMAQ